jgi:hypothetical protein
MPFFEPTSKQLHKTVLSRDFSQQNMLGFRNELGMADWTNVTDKTSVDEAYEEFWTTYNGLYNRFFQVKRTRFNKNKHKIHNFMTNGLLVSRNTKKNLHMTSISDPSAINIQRYKNFKTIYHRVLRGAKRLYYTSKLEENAGNPKKTWETLNEILGKSRHTETVDRINVNGIPSSDPVEIANQFNSFLEKRSRIGCSPLKRKRKN